MKEVSLVKVQIETLAKPDDINSIPIQYWPEIKRVCERDDLLVDVNQVVKTVNAPIFHFTDIQRRIEGRNEIEVRQDFYICWTPEVEQVIGMPLAEISRLQKALNISEDENGKLRSWRRRLEYQLGEVNKAGFWKRLKFLFKRVEF